MTFGLPRRNGANMATGAELIYRQSTALQMATAIFSDGVPVTGAGDTRPASSAAVYSNGQLTPGVVPSNTGVILSTGGVVAGDLVNDLSIRVCEVGDVDYVHILFDSHQVMFSHGLATERFLPGPQGISSLEQAIVDEICTIVQELNPCTGAGYGPAVRRVLKGNEAQVFPAARRAA